MPRNEPGNSALCSRGGQAMNDQPNKAVWLLREELKRIDNSLDNAIASRDQFQQSIDRLQADRKQLQAALDTLLRDSAPMASDERQSGEAAGGTTNFQPKS